MKYAIIFAVSLSAVAARPTRHHLFRREVPQEHSHEQFLRTVNTNLKLDNPDNIQDAVFGLLGNAAASAGQGNIADTDCLQQATADQAFTNAKAAGDVDGMTAALVYRALERNTGAVGQASVACTAIQATNPEIAALSQHQDPASSGAAETNKNITLELAKQIASIGGAPQVALKSGTFKPGQVGDTTGAGNSCDDANDAVGCIFSQNLLVEDASADEINAAVADVTASGAAAAGSSTAAAAADQCADAAAADASAGAANVNATAANAAGSSNLDLGTATNPTVVFGAGFDGRKEDSFEPADKTEFTHGSAQNIKVISDFICGQLQTKFKASTAAVDACNQGATAAQAQTGQAAADAFNAALGF
ncbi:hypothetical protein GTA08_BOTSDO10749 [Neofusicoccum parvum]|uniref:Uncharacterized protein n=1 Tax=Neofusicoccum parvum TaxID=310453 RepID=A0ACB5S3G5_9PEZI|nr:hypothetical protein GTA08_BOTSDO10749 [Neofusicoccum parvum]